MINVTVKYLMAFSQVTGKKSETLTIEDGLTVENLLQQLYVRYGRKLKKLVETDLDNRSVIFVVNGEEKDISTSLNQGDEVLISYPVGGG
jgi:MoaD family protein